MFNNIKRKERIVIKIGSSSLTNKNGELNLERIKGYVMEIAELSKKGNEIILVSSGAVAAGFRILGFPGRPNHIEGKQAAAAVGQGLLIQEYNKEFRKQNLHTAQILITRQDFSRREQYMNAYNTLNVLLRRKIIPIINENDTVSIEELTFGDNDMLSALVGGLVHADRLIILTDIDGVYDKDPRMNKDANKLNYIHEVTTDMVDSTSVEGSLLGTGGMQSKMKAAKMALSLGVHVYIGTYHGKKTLLNIINNMGTGTYFSDYDLHTVKAKKQWIAFHSNTSGFLLIDHGARVALTENGKSLLPAGLCSVYGHFSAGDVVEVKASKGELIGKGIVNYSSSELKRMRMNSEDTDKEQTKFYNEEVIHRDNWFSFQEDNQKREENE